MMNTIDFYFSVVNVQRTIVIPPALMSLSVTKTLILLITYEPISDRAVIIFSHGTIIFYLMTCSESYPLNVIGSSVRLFVCP